MLDLLNEVFEFDPADAFFQTNLANCTPSPVHALDSEIEKHYIAISDGKVVGVLGAYPSLMYISENSRSGAKFVIKSCGIGQVACAKAYRGRGIMRHLMESAMDEMKRNGVQISHLGGEPSIYGVYGFAHAGNTVSFSFHKHSFAKFVNEDCISIKKADISDYTILNELVSLFPAYIQRDRRAWEKNFMRKPYAWLIGEGSGGKGFVGVYETEIVEAQGDVEVVKKLILHHMEGNGLETVSLTYPEANLSGDLLYEELWRVSSCFAKTNAGLVAFCNPDSLLKELSPILDRYDMGVNKLDEEEKNGLLRILFGNGSQPCDETSAFAKIKPLLYWIPKADAV